MFKLWGEYYSDSETISPSKVATFVLMHEIGHFEDENSIKFKARLKELKESEKLSGYYKLKLHSELIADTNAQDNELRELFKLSETDMEEYKLYHAQNMKTISRRILGSDEFKGKKEIPEIVAIDKAANTSKPLEALLGDYDSKFV